MLLQLDTLSGFFAHGFDDVIDVRSPAEFAEDHVPGAISLPVLDNEERARVGTIYKQESRFGARKIGAALVIRNIARHLETELADRPARWRPMVYCWRGGQRSGTFTWLLREVGWRAEQVDGGYRTYRRLVAAMLHDTPLPFRFVVLAGMTCTAKTALLEELGREGMQVLDLEGLARHRGSVFGGHADPQPAQKMFESRIARALCALDPARPVVVEAESSKIGDCLVPPRLWERMCEAPRVEVTADLEQRSDFFLTAYEDLVADPDGFCATLDKLVRLQGHERVEAWQGLVRQGAFRQVAAELMRDHYDPRYARSEARHGNVPAEALHLASLAPAGLRAAAQQRLGARTALGHLRQRHVLGGGEFRQQVVELVDEADLRAARGGALALAAAVHRHPAQPDLALIGAVEQARDVQQRRFPGPRGRHQRHHLAGIHGQRGLVQHGDLAGRAGGVDAGDVLELQDLVTHSAAHPQGSSAPRGGRERS